MIISEKLLWFGLRGCLYCGSLDRGPDGLCLICTEDLSSWLDGDNNLFHQEIHKLAVYTLYEWLPGRQEVLSKLVHILKGRTGEKLWQYYAEEFIRRRWSEKVSKKSYLLVPAPARDGSKDHAHCFAKGLSHAGVGYEIYNCLSRGSIQGSQKKRARSERERAVLYWAENFTYVDFVAKAAGKHVIFVDDVVTTASTARAAWRTLGKPRDFAVWALAQRHLSCGASRDLV